ncbi:MAG TPA: ABC transporter permease [Longimicrobiales bacterium]|nr:ABC transporter permease [Longimicrobiales bacterium]
MRLGSVLRQLLDDIRRQRLRTILTVLGITWGTTAVVTLLAFGTGFERQMTINARGIGDGVVILSGGRTTVPFQGFAERRPIRLVEEDADLLDREVVGIERITPEYGTWGRYVSRGTRRTNVYLTGVEAEYGEVRNVFARAGGRFINNADVSNQRRVIVLGNEVKQLLFGDEEAVGQEVRVGRTPFTVVGVMVEKTQDSSYNARDEDRAFIPRTTYRTLEGSRNVGRLLYTPVDPELSPAVNQEVRQVLARKYTFDPDDQDALNVWDTNESLKLFKYIFIGFNLFLGMVGCFTLVVGGVGVANIMFVVVQERTREIGIRRSLGARRRDVLLQVLLEATLIVASGAFLGFVLSLGITRVMGLLPIQEFVGVPIISGEVVLLTGSLLLLVALAAGLLPARRAAALDPADALRWGT